MSIELHVTVDKDDNPIVTPEIQKVPKGDKNVKLVWNMDTSGWEITDISGLPIDEFSGKKKQGTGYEIKDKNDTDDSYTYHVEIKNLVTGMKLSVDPTIKNEG